MSTLTSLVKRHPLVTFFVLAYGLAWLMMIPTGGFMLAYGPAIAAFVVLGVTEGRAGVKSLLGQMGRWRVSAIWYVIALTLSLITNLAAAALNVLLGATAGPIGPWHQVFLLIPLFFVIGGQWEEPGWTGYALPRLQAGRSALAASLILGLLRVGWHLPLFVLGGIAWSDVPTIVAAQIIITWLFNSTGRSVLIVMLLHLMNNVSAEFFSPMFAGVDAVTFGWLKAAVFVVLGVFVVLWARPAHLARQSAVSQG